MAKEHIEPDSELMEERGSYLTMDRDAKRLTRFLKKDRRFHCHHIGFTAKPSQCAKSESSSCFGCHYRSIAKTIFSPDKKGSSGFLDELRKEAQKQGTVTQEATVEKESQVQEPAVEKEIPMHQFSFHRYNPGTVSKSWKPVCAGITLKQNVLYLNTKAVRQFGLGRYRFVVLAFDPEKKAMLLEFSEQNTDRRQLAVTHRNGGDAKIGIIGFRKYYDLATQGRFCVSRFNPDSAQMLVFLNDEMREE